MPADLSPFVEAILAEIAERLTALAERGETHAIDLRSLPMAPEDREALAAALGQGEVSVRLDLSGETLIDETGLAGLWHIRHLGPGGDVLRETLEIALVPELLPAHPADVAGAARALGARLAAPSPPLPSVPEEEVSTDA